MASAQHHLQSTSVWHLTEAEFLESGRAESVLHGLSNATDAIAREAFHAALGSLADSAAMVAVGAYGRRETFPYSGADIVILLDASPNIEPVKSALADFARRLWDAGLRLNYSVRTLAECLDAHEQNVELTVNLLDRRFLAGDDALHLKLEGKLPAVLAKHAHEICRHLAQAARTRHAKYRNTCHHLEPDVKESPGGLRDLRLVDWLTRLGVPYEAQSGKLKEAGAFVSAARCFLHYHSGRDRNVLDVDALESATRQGLTHGRKPLEWLREYFRHSRTIFNEVRRAVDASDRSHSSLLDSFREYSARLSNAEFTVSRDRLLLRSPGQLETDPGLIFRMLEFTARHGVPPAPETERRLEAVRPAFAAQCAASRPLWPALGAILALPHVGMALRALDNTGLLAALFPEWAAIEDLPVADTEQQYTADEHALRAIEGTARLPAATDPGERRFAELLLEIDSPAVLLFAILFRAAAHEAPAAMARIQMPAEARDTVEFLVEHEGDLAAAMSRDIEDPATARTLADRAGTIERLKLLAVLTYAEISAIDLEAATSWRLEQLWRAYSVTRDELTRELETDRIQQVPEDLHDHAEFIKGFPVRYLRARAPGEIAAHARLFELSRPTGVAVQLDHLEGAYRLTVVARDRPFLFASFAGAVSSFGLDILKAEAFSNTRGVVLDTFVFADPKRMLQLNPSEIDRLQDLIHRVALGKTDARRLMRERPQTDNRKPGRPPQVRFDSETCDSATLVEIIAEDRPGLLYSLATVFSTNACNIDVVLIDTKGHRAIDVFYVAYEGRKLSTELEARLEEKLVAAC